MVKGKKTEFAFNGFAFNSEDSRGNPIVMLGLHQDEQYQAGTTRSGWLMGSEFKFPNLVSGTENNLLFGKQRINGDSFQVFLDQMPTQYEGKDKAPRYNLVDCTMVGIEIEDE